MDNIQLNTEGNVISFGEIELDKPMGISLFVSMMQKTRQAVDRYFNELVKADESLNKFFEGQGQGFEIAKKFRDKLLGDIAKEQGIEVRMFEPVAEEVSPEINEEILKDKGGLSVHASPTDWHIHYKNLYTDMDMMKENTARRIVFLCEEGFLFHTIMRQRTEEHRGGIRVNTDMLWEYIEGAYGDLVDALDPRIRAELPALLISVGWRVIGGSRHSDTLYVIPYGVGVPGCHSAGKREDNHPFWGL